MNFGQQYHNVDITIGIEKGSEDIKEKVEKAIEKSDEVDECVMVSRVEGVNDE